MTYNAWLNLKDKINEKFKVEDYQKSVLEEVPDSVCETLIFNGPNGRIKLQWISKPKTLGEKTLYSGRVGSHVKVDKIYSADEKAEIVAYIIAYDAEHKRGGMKAASDKYGVSVVTLSNWKKKDKGPRKGKTKAKKVAAKKSVKTASAPAKKIADNPEAILARLQAIRSEINTLEKEYEGLKKKL